MKRKKKKCNEKSVMIYKSGLENTIYMSCLHMWDKHNITAKIVKKSGKIILKITSAMWKNLKFDVLWKRSGSPPRFVRA